MTLRQVSERAQGQALGSGGGATGAGSLGVGTAQRDLTANQNAGTTGLSAQEANRVAAENARAAASPAPAATSGGRTVNINLAGLGSTSVRVASDADAAKVEALLRQIEQAASRSGG